MAADKKITELTPALAINGSDIGLLASGGHDYGFTFSTLLQYIANNLNTGAVTLFGAVLPQNNEGNNGDIFINTAGNSFAQKINGNWVIKYRYQTGGGASLFGLGTPDNAAGNNGDVYINTATGIFYKKNNGTWAQVFSMQTGPAGPPGLKGDKGTAGANGNTILSGTINPSNLNTGTNGDFYINVTNWTVFGPKANGAWPAGMQIETAPAPIKVNITAGVTACPLVYQYDGSIGDDPSPRIKLQNGDGSYTFDNNVAIDHSSDGLTYTITGQPDGNGRFLYSYLLVFYPGGLFSQANNTGPVAAGTFPFSLPYTLQS